MNILIVGGGIGGLTAAIALGRAGHAVTLCERQAQFTDVGAAIVLAPNAARALGWLGVALEAHGRQVMALDIVRADGTLLQRIDAARMAANYGPTWALLRPVLHRALLAALPQSVAVRLGCELRTLQLDGRSVKVRLAAGRGEERYDLVIGADGLRSAVRQRVLGPTRYRYSGVTCYRGVVRNPGIDRAIEAWGGAARIGVVPLADDRLYYYLVKSAPPRAPALQFPEGFRESFAHVRGEVARLFDVLDAPPPLHHDLDELQAPVWGVGRIVLLGDSAHAMTPNQGQGAAMAIEDALALTSALSTGHDGAFERYVASRHARVRAVQLDSRRLGRMAHLTHPALAHVRDAALKLIPQAVSDAQYRRIVEPGLSLIPTAQPARTLESAHA